MNAAAHTSVQKMLVALIEMVDTIASAYLDMKAMAMIARESLNITRTQLLTTLKFHHAETAPKTLTA